MKNDAKKLTKDKIEYLHIQYAGWSTASYYSRLFGMDAGDEPAEMQTYLLEREGITFVRFKFPSCDAPHGQGVQLRGNKGDYAAASSILHPPQRQDTPSIYGRLYNL